MEGYINENQWVDLSGLPRRKFGNSTHIDWKNSNGAILPFMYKGISGYINILKYNLKNNSLLIYINGYSKPDGDIVYLDTLRLCKLGRVLHKKIIDIAPELISYLQDKNDAYKYSPQSNTRISTTCPFCGFKKTHIISNLYQYGFGCPQCSDGKSYAEKFMFNIFKQLKINFKNEVTKKDKGFEWIAGNYRYDFYFEINNDKYFVELDGHFHMKDMIGTYKQVVQSDQEKNRIATEHNIDIIRIDCCYDNENNRFYYIKNNILNSKLYKILDLNVVDFDLANKAALNSNIYVAAKLWNENYTINQIADKIGVSRYTIPSYLKIASDIGLCSYNRTIAENRRIIATKNKRSKPIALYNDGILLGVFSSSLELSEKSDKLLGMHFRRENITSACYKNRSCYGYIVKYITKEEYEQLLPQFITIQNEYNGLQGVN